MSNTPFKMKGSPFQRNFGIGSPLNQQSCTDGSCPDFSVGGSKFWRGIGAWWQSKRKTWKKKRQQRKAKRLRKKREKSKEGLVFDTFTRTWVKQPYTK